MAVVDISDWEAADEEPLGTKPKQWVRDPDGVRWLWKESTIQKDRRHGEFRKGDDWAEFVAGRVGVALGLPVAEVKLAVRGDLCGVVSRSVLSDDREVLVHGNELLHEAGMSHGHPRDRTGYTLDAVAAVLVSATPPIADEALVSAFDWFTGYLLLDALVGNTDRHQDNWAVIRSPAGRRLAPSFDHASCLGFQLSDAERAERLETRDEARTVAAYARRACTKFEREPRPIEVAMDAVGRLHDKARRSLATRFAHPPPLAPILQEVPSGRMSSASREFAAALYAENSSLLTHPLRTMEP